MPSMARIYLIYSVKESLAYTVLNLTLKCLRIIVFFDFPYRKRAFDRKKYTVNSFL